MTSFRDNYINLRVTKRKAWTSAGCESGTCQDTGES